MHVGPGLLPDGTGGRLLGGGRTQGAWCEDVNRGPAVQAKPLSMARAVLREWGQQTPAWGPHPALHLRL